MPILDTLVLLFMLGGLGVGGAKIALAINKRREKLKRQHQGELNAKGSIAPDNEVCYICENSKGLINPSQDLFINEKWFHKSCFGEVKKEL